MSQRFKPLKAFLYSLIVGVVILSLLGSWTLIAKMLTAPNDAQVVFGFIFGVALIGIVGSAGVALTQVLLRRIKELENDDSSKDVGDSSSGGDSK